MLKLVYFIVLNQLRTRDETPLENLVFLVKNKDILNYSIHFSEEQALRASKHISYDVIIACAYVPEQSIEYQVDRLVVRPEDFSLRHIHGYYPDKNNHHCYITNPYFDATCLTSEATSS